MIHIDLFPTTGKSAGRQGYAERFELFQSSALTGEAVIVKQKQTRLAIH